MEFLNVGLGELLLIAILALIVFGPERLPDMLRQAGRFFAQVRGIGDEFQRALMEEAKPLREPFDEARREIEETAKPLKEVQEEIKGTSRTVNNLAAPPVARTNVNNAGAIRKSPVAEPEVKQEEATTPTPDKVHEEASDDSL